SEEQALRSANQPYAAAGARALGTTTLSATEREWIAARFTDNLHAIVRAARTAGAVPVVASLAQDLRDTVPGAWRHTPDLPEAVTAQWTTLAEEGDRLRRAGDCPDAVTTFETALRIDHRPAALHYALARCLERLGRWRPARRAYRHASDLDEVPLGAPTELNATIRRVATQQHVAFLDPSRAFERATPHGVVGRTLFLDHVHPSTAGHQLIAATVAETLHRRALPAPVERWSPQPYRDRDPAEILREHPELVRKEYESRVLVSLLLGRNDRAGREVAEAEQRFPELRTVAQ